MQNKRKTLKTAISISLIIMFFGIITFTYLLSENPDVFNFDMRCININILNDIHNMI